MHGDYRKSTRDTSDPKTSPFGALREELHSEQTDFLTALRLLEDAPAHLRAQMASYMLADRAMARWENTPVKLGARDEDWVEALGGTRYEGVIRGAILDLTHAYWRTHPSLTPGTHTQLTRMLEHIERRDVMEHPDYMGRLNGLMNKVFVKLDSPGEEALGSWANGLFFLEYGGEHAKGLRLILREHERCDALPHHIPERCIGRIARAKRALSQTVSHPPEDTPIWTMRATWPASLDAFLIARMVGSFER